MKKKPITDGKYCFDVAAADRAVEFFSSFITHVEGEWAGQPFILEKWQEDEIIRPLFGWKRKADGLRRYRMVYVEIPRKNGKSAVGAGLGLYLLFCDNEPSAKVFSCAADRDQAAIVFDVAKMMVENNEDLSDRCTPFRRSIFVPQSKSLYQVLSSDVKTKHGKNTHACIFDELHTQPNRELFDVMKTSFGARRQPVMALFTTAGYDRTSICWEMHEYARKVKAGLIKDETFLPVIYTTEESEDWTDPKMWKKANPNLGVSKKLEYMEAECNYAKLNPTAENTFRRLELNQWTSQEVRWMSMRAWNASAGEPIRETELMGRDCWAGLDLSSTTDITALAYVFPDGEQFDVLMRFWIPEDRMWERVRRDRVPYDVWVKQGWLLTTPGNVIDNDFILYTIDQDRKKWNICELAYDRWGARQISVQMMTGARTGQPEVDPIQVIEFGQGYASMSPPMKELLRLVLNKQLRHGNNPILNWMADNVVAKQDPAGNIKPDKEKSTEKIDGVVSLIMALGRAVLQEGGSSVYETRGIMSVGHGTGDDQ